MLWLLDTQGAATRNVRKNLEAMEWKKLHLLDCVFLQGNPKEMETSM